jgi:putative DNA primase/helicase
MMGLLAPHAAASAMLEAMCAAGMRPRNPGAVLRDLLRGELIRFPCDGDNGPNGWAVLHLDAMPAGSFGSWKLGIKANWRADAGAPIAGNADRAAMAVRLAQERQEREMRHLEAERQARCLWQASSPVGNHPYLVTKRLAEAAAGQGDPRRQIVVRQSGNDLLVAMRTVATSLCNLQRIGPDGRKRFLPGGRLHGAFWSAGRFAGAPIIAVGEGFATMAAVHLATGLPVAAAMTAANLVAMALALHGRCPEARLILCPDMDTGPQGNIGLEKANAAAAAVPDALVARPPRPAAWPEGKGHDFADTFNAPGGSELIRCALGMKGFPNG